MTKKKLRSIVLDNYITSQIAQESEVINHEKNKDFQVRMEEYAVKTLQRFYRVWKARRNINMSRWKIEHRKQRIHSKQIY